MKLSLKERYQDVLEGLSKDENYMAIQICRLGYPQEERGIPTACVAWDDSKKKVKFLFNKKFADILTDEEFTFVSAHESIHLLNGHVSLLKTKFDEMDKAGKEEKDKIKFQKKFNIAADCVVNDSLINLYGFKKVMDVETKEKPKIIYGQNVVKRDCHDLTVMEVFYLLTDEIMKQFEGTEMSHDWSSFFDEDGNLIEEFADQIKGFYTHNGENSHLSDDDLEKIEKLKKHFEKNAQIAGGSGKVGAYRAVDNMSKVSINWNKLARNFVDTKKQENVWNRPNKKLISVYPDILLPSLAPEEKDSIFIAIDSSGSIDYDALKLFVSVVKSISSKFIITSISFDHDCYHYDIKSNQNPQGGGGTNFQIIEDWIQTNLKKYPKSVFVLTDGEGSVVTPKHPERWCWVLYGSSSNRFCKDMRHFTMQELLK